LKLEKRRFSAPLVIQHSRALGLESSVFAQHFRHVPKRFIEFQILINSFDGAALWHPVTVGAAARIIPLAAFRNVLLNLCGASRYVERPGNTASIAHTDAGFCST
jgi:hypothetical protein